MPNDPGLMSGKGAGMAAYSVRVRLTLWYAGVTLLILCLLGLSVGLTLRSTLIRTADRDQMLFVRAMQRRAAHASSLQDAFPLRMINRLPRPGDASSPSELLQSKLWPRVLDQNGNPASPMLPDGAIDLSGFRAAAAGRTSTTNIIVDDQPVRVISAPLEIGGHQAGVLQISRQLLDDERTEDLRSVGFVMLCFIPIAVIVSALGALFLTGRAIDPVRQITGAASQIGSGNLSERLAVTGRDEFADLAMTFNGMLDRLEDGFRRLEQAYEQQRRFTGDASHELRTPLTIIKANASLALTGERTNAEYVSALRTIDSAADRTNRLIQDLLLLARADAGQLDIEKHPASISEIVQTAYAHFAMTDQPSGPTVLIEPIEPGLSALVNADMVVRLLDNLISNAWRHTPDGGEIRISAELERPDGDTLRLTVADTGEGIAPEHLPYLTERFYRADASRVRKHGGTGLGLAICQSIVDLHGGKVTIRSELGKGTQVDVALPALPAANPPEQGDSGSAQPVRKASAKQPRTRPIGAGR